MVEGRRFVRKRFSRGASHYRREKVVKGIRVVWMGHANYERNK